MQTLSTTVLAVVGSQSAGCLASFDDARNVTVVDPPRDLDASARAMEAWARTVRSRSLYTMLDADPLAPVVQAWSSSFRQGPRGDLEIAVTEALGRWRAESIGLPDFYLVLNPDELSTSHRDWYLGVLHEAAPRRVIPVEAEGALVADAIGGLSAGRWWPALDQMLDDIEHTLPDRLMVADESDPGRGSAGSSLIL